MKNLERKKKIESQKKLLDKFIISNKQNIIKNLNIRKKKSLLCWNAQSVDMGWTKCI